MRKCHLIRWIITFTLVLILPACSYQKRFETGPSDYGSRTISDPDTSLQSRPNSTSIQSMADHNNSQIEFNQASSDDIAAMKGIRDSFVFVTDKNAYVAIVLDQTATGMKGKGYEKPSDNTIGSNQFHFRPRDGKTLQPGTIMTDKYSFDTIPNHDDLSSELKQQAAAKIMEAYPRVQAVFISANQHFINRMSLYAHEVWGGNTLQGRVQEFNALVQNTFGADSVLPNTNP